tara:strand:- start:20 stop:628 length:609 start_codon:yes stop_codon:yes gene_type:complete
MQFYSGHIYHIYNQGNNRQPIFFEKENYLFFIAKMRKHLLPYCDVLAWCLMPNHFHWLIKVKEDYKNNVNFENNAKIVESLNRSIGSLQSSYTRAINTKFDRSGSLFRSRTKAKSLHENSRSRDNYGINCFLYIHQNPLRAEIVSKIEDWEFSSFRDYSGFRNGNIINKELAKELFELPNTAEEFYKLSYQTIPNYISTKFY